jgi:hypothetical protein
MGGPCAKVCGCQKFWPPLAPATSSAALRCAGCDHHLSFHSLGADSCSWQKFSLDEDGDPLQDPHTGKPVVLKVCKCTKFFDGENMTCEGCSHHISFHSGAKRIDPPRPQGSEPVQERAAATGLPANVSRLETTLPRKSPRKSSAAAGASGGAPSLKTQALSEAKKAQVDPEWVKLLPCKLPSSLTLHVDCLISFM